MAPELFKHKPYDGEKVDMFSLGVTLFKLVVQRPPFLHAKPNDKIYKLFILNQHDNFWQAQENKSNRVFTPEFKTLINSLLSPTPE